MCQFYSLKKEYVLYSFCRTRSVYFLSLIAIFSPPPPCFQLLQLSPPPQSLASCIISFSEYIVLFIKSFPNTMIIFSKLIKSEKKQLTGNYNAINWTCRVTSPTVWKEAHLIFNKNSLIDKFWIWIVIFSEKLWQIWASWTLVFRDLFRD